MGESYVCGVARVMAAHITQMLVAVLKKYPLCLTSHLILLTKFKAEQAVEFRNCRHPCVKTRGGWKRSRELPRATIINYAKSVFCVDLSVRQ